MTISVPRAVFFSKTVSMRASGKAAVPASVKTSQSVHPVLVTGAGPESLSLAEQVSVIGAALGRRIRFEELSREEFRRATADRWPGAVVDMLLAAWGATIGRPAFVTSTVADIVGSPARTFRQWAADHADAFRGPAASYKSDTP
jgi:hypothetical protein